MFYKSELGCEALLVRSDVNQQWAVEFDTSASSAGKGGGSE